MFKPENKSISSANQNDLNPQESVYKCNVCGIKITAQKFLICVGSDSPFHSFLNPEGFYFDVMTFSSCESVVDVPPATKEHTWFVDYAWRILGCGGCQQHLGWRFENQSKTPFQFFGLIRDRLQEE